MTRPPARPEWLSPSQTGANSASEPLSYTGPTTLPAPVATPRPADTPAPSAAPATANSEPIPAGLRLLSSGSGFFITSDGYAVTNAHVVRGGTHYRFRPGGGTITARLIKVDTVNDIAVLKTEGQFAPLPLTKSSEVRLGSIVATVGFPNKPIDLQGIASIRPGRNLKRNAGIRMIRDIFKSADSSAAGEFRRRAGG